jgi:glycosyltransferase involved in cell wall biosynthesis
MEKYKDGKIIDFCIPSFNQGERTAALVKNILNYKGNDIGVIVSDNCSEDNTIELLNQIKDNRFRLVCNPYNIGATRNFFKALRSANAKYAILCVDKDFVEHEKIGNLIDILKENKDIAVGRCTLNMRKESKSVVYQRGFFAILNMAYKSTHPTGRFYKTDLFNKIYPAGMEGVIENFISADIFDAHMALEGNAIIINIPIFYMESIEQVKQTKSYTSFADNPFFFPKARLKELSLYSKSIQSLNLAHSEKRKLVRKVFFSRLFSSTIEYRKHMTNASICQHYHLSPRKVGAFELLQIDIAYCMSFLQMKSGVNIFYKIFICVEAQLKLMVCALREQKNNKLNEYE